MHPTLLLSSLLLLSPLSLALTIRANPLTVRDHKFPTCFSGPFGTIGSCDQQCTYNDDSKPIWGRYTDPKTQLVWCTLQNGPIATLPNTYGPVGDDYVQPDYTSTIPVGSIG